MANEKVSALPTVTSADLTDIIYAIQGGVSVQETLTQVRDLIADEIVLLNAGDPNGLVAGTQKQLLFDTANDMWWGCKTTGTAALAVWIPMYGAMTNGQLIIGDSAGVPQLANLTAGTGISISNSAGNISISTTGLPFAYTEVTTTSQAMNINSGYITNNAALVSLTLPPVSVIGDRVEIVGKGAGGWRIIQAASQQIHIGSHASTVGISGYVESTNQYDSLILVCIEANLRWEALSGPQGSLNTN